MMSSRTPVFRAFPRVGIPPHYGTWEIYSHRVEQMMRGGAIEDYTYLWWDVRPHPNLGTVETRIFDQQTTLDHTVALAALTIALAHRMSAFYDDEQPLVESPTELIDDNKVRAAVGGMDGRLIDFWRGEQVPAEEMARGLLDELADDAAELGCTAELELVEDLLGGNTGAHRQLRFWKLRDENLARAGQRDRRRHPPVAPRADAAGYSRWAWRSAILKAAMAETELSVVCKNCGAEVSPYVTECPYCGTRLRKRAPKLERRGDELQARETRRDRRRRRAAERRARAPRLAFAAERPYVTLAAILGPAALLVVQRAADLSLFQPRGDRRGGGQHRLVAVPRGPVRLRRSRLPVRDRRWRWRCSSPTSSGAWAWCRR